MANRSKKNIRTRNFEIPKEFIGTFFSELEDTELEYSLQEIDEENEVLIVSVEYTSNEKEDVMDLIESLDEYLNENEDGEDDPDDEDE